ncbi:MAG: histidine kinase, partial [Novosphingobium sp.]|nr:histidine kinase [Novosphingobium sp.]
MSSRRSVALDTASTTPPTLRAADPGRVAAPAKAADPAGGEIAPANPVAPHTGSLSRRMMLIAAGWITILLLLGGIALDRTLTGLIEKNFDDQLEYMLTAMIGAAEIGPDGEVFFNRPLGDQRFLEPNSGLYWQITGEGHED